MSQTHGLFRLAHPLSLALAGARAPVCWQRELARAAARLDALRRACVWIDEVVAVYPRLRDEPLLGNCLAVLAAEVARPAVVEPEVARRARARPTASVASAAREQRSASNRSRPTRRSGFGPSADRLTVHPRIPYRPGESRPHNAGLDLTGVPRQAGLALLRRLVGEQALSHQVDPPLGNPVMSPGVGRPHRSLDRPQAKARRNTPSLQPMNFREQSSEPLTETRRRPRAQPRSRAHEPTASRAWRIDLARRAVHAFHHTNLSPLTPGEQGEALLSRQWSAPIAGPLAPQDLLIRLAGLAQHGGIAPPRSLDPVASHPTPDVRPQSSPTAGHRSDGAIWPAPSGSKHREPLLPLEAGDDYRALEGAQHGLTPGHTDGSGNIGPSMPESVFWPADRVAPPTIIPSLPPLIPPQVVNGPAPPVATTTARQGARQEEATAADDNLDVLAAKIKRILDEEARRHGIDV